MAIMEKTGIFATDMGRSEILTFWNLSMYTQVDELSNERHLQMRFDEFMEAVCRVAEKTAIPNFFSDQQYKNLEEYLTRASPQDQQKNKKKPLHEKIEAFLILMGRTCLPKASQFMQNTELK